MPSTATGETNEATSRPDVDVGNGILRETHTNAEEVDPLESIAPIHNSQQIFADSNPIFKIRAEGLATLPHLLSSPQSRKTIERHSFRPYSERVCDGTDFASVWEPIVQSLSAEISNGPDLSMNVHTFPECSEDHVPRQIIVSSEVSLDSSMEDAITEKIQSALRPPFLNTSIRFLQGEIQRCARPQTRPGEYPSTISVGGDGDPLVDQEVNVDKNIPGSLLVEVNEPGETPWLGTDKSHQDMVCEPKNAEHYKVLSIGVSIGPSRSDDAATLGGIIEIGGDLYGTTASHTFEALEMNKRPNRKVIHPSKVDVRGRNSVQHIGEVESWSNPGDTRPSRTFLNTGVATDLTNIEMDWCVFHLNSIDGMNTVPVPCLAAMDKRVMVMSISPVHGNCVVYSAARTSGFSYGYTSDVPGLQIWKGKTHREWTIRQYHRSSLGARSTAETEMDRYMEGMRQWITSGIGAPGDSGAWLMQESDHKVVGHVWARNKDFGGIDNIRQTYFTPFEDLKDDIEAAFDKSVSLPTWSEEEITINWEAQGSRHKPRRTGADEPWNVYSIDNLGQSRSRVQNMVSGFEVAQFEADESARAPLSRAGGDSLMHSAPSSENLSDERSTKRRLHNRTMTSMTVIADDTSTSIDLTPGLVSDTMSMSSGPAEVNDLPEGIQQNVAPAVLDDFPSGIVVESEEPVRSKARPPAGLTHSDFEALVITALPVFTSL